MPFLALNGLTIPVSRGGQGASLDIGGSGRAFDGSLVFGEEKVKVGKIKVAVGIVGAREGSRFDPAG